jgi:2'-5' RNA ligase
MNERKLFLGIPIVGKARTRLSREISSWENLPVFPVRPENLYVTISFLGLVTDEHAFRIAEIAKRVCAESEPFDLYFSEIETEPDAENPKTIRLSGEPSEALLSIRNALDRELFGRSVGGKTLRPHVTLGRIRRREFSELPEESRKSVSKPVSLVEPVSSIVLFESVGSGAKRQYLSMDEFPLG